MAVDSVDSVESGTEVVIDGMTSVLVVEAAGGTTGALELLTAGVPELEDSGVETGVLNTTGVVAGTEVLADVEIVATVDTVSEVVPVVVRDRVVVDGVEPGGAGIGTVGGVAAVEADSVQVATVTVTVVYSAKSQSILEGFKV